MAYTLSDVEWAYDSMLDSPSTRPLGKCKIYCRANKYTVLRRTTDAGTKIAVNGHRLALMKKMQTVNIPEGVQASHLCHKPGCVEIDHISPETDLVNKSRKACEQRRLCLGHPGYPMCIFQMGCIY